EVNKRFPHLSRRDSEVIINAIFDSMVDALAQGDRIEIRGFGSFVVKHRRARQGRNPKSGALVSVAAKRVPFFKVGKELRLRVDGKSVELEDGVSEGNNCGLLGEWPISTKTQRRTAASSVTNSRRATAAQRLYW